MDKSPCSNNDVWYLVVVVLALVLGMLFFVSVLYLSTPDLDEGREDLQRQPLRGGDSNGCLAGEGRCVEMIPDGSWGVSLDP